MSNYIRSTPLCIEDDVLGSWLGMIPVTFAAVYVGTTFKGLSEITHGWDEVSTIQWVFLLLVSGISVTLFAFITRIAKASQMNTNLVTEMLPLVARKELDIPKTVIVRIDSLREDLERKMTVTA